MAGGHGTSWKRLGTGELLTEDAAEGLGHILPTKTYVSTLGALLVLTVITVAVANFDFGDWNAVVAMLIASIKAALVMCFFMHLKFEGKLLIAFALYPLLILFLLIGGTYTDEVDRRPPEPARAFADQPIFTPLSGGGHADEAAH